MKNTSNDSDQDWRIVFIRFRKKLHSPWLTIYLLPIVGFLCAPFIGDVLMTSTNAKLIGFGVGLTILIWAAILIVIQNTPSKDNPKDIRNLIDSDSKEKYPITQIFKIKPFLVFQNMQFFDIWHQEVMFRLGLPKQARKLSTNEIANRYTVKQYANWKRHPDSSDQRIKCSYNEDIPTDLIDEKAESKYKFIKVSHGDLEEMGFIKDKPNIVGEELFEFHAPDITESKEYLTPIINRPWVIFPEYNFEFILCLYRNAEIRKKYIVDLGFIENKSRISIYLDNEDCLCFRIIDENSKSYILRVQHNLFNKKFQFNFKFGGNTKKSYMEIYVNGKAIALQYFDNIIPFYYNNKNMMIVGGNLDGNYCAKLMWFIGKIFVAEQNKIHSLLSYDSSNIDAMVFSGQDIIVYEDKGVPIKLNQN